MIKSGLLTAICILCVGCASAPDAALSSAQSRPVTKVMSQDVDIPALLEKAEAHYDNRAYSESYDLFRAILMHDPGLVTARIGIGNSALALNKNEEAYQAFDSLIVETLSETEKAQLLAGLALVGAGAVQLEDTEAHLKYILNLVPDDARLWRALGIHYDKHEQWVDSAEAYVNALKVGNSQASTINNLGISLMMQGRLDSAMEKFEQALQIAPGTELFDNNRRLVMALQGDYISAISDLDDRRAALLCNDAGYIAMQRGNTALAKKLLEHSIAINPVYNPKAEANLNAL